MGFSLFSLSSLQLYYNIPYKYCHGFLMQIIWINVYC
nr:MAG TPA: hypothetical protein [Caudoviricetes sp.]